MNRVLIETNFHEIGFHRQRDNRIIVTFFSPRGLIPSSSLNNSKKNILSKIIEIHIPNKITHYNGNIKEKRLTIKKILNSRNTYPQL